MTCYISHRYDDRLEVLSDSAIWEVGSWKLMGISPKCYRLANLPLVLVGRGDAIVTARLAGELSQRWASKTVDDALADLGPWLAEKRELFEDGDFLDGLASPFGGLAQDLLIGGWSPTLGTVHRYVIISRPDEDTNLHNQPSFEPIDPGYCLVATAMTDMDFAEADFFVSDLARSLRHEGSRLFELVRRKHVYPHDSTEPICTVGGQVILTTVRKTGVTYESLGGWNDMIFQRLRFDAKFVPKPTFDDETLRDGGHRTLLRA